MAGDVETEQFFLPRQFIFLCCLWTGAKSKGGDCRSIRQKAEERVLILGSIHPLFMIFKEVVDICKQYPSFIKFIQGPALDKGFERLLIQIFILDTVEEVGQIFEFAVCLSLCCYGTRNSLTEVFNSSEAKANSIRFLPAGRQVSCYYRKLRETFVDRGRQNIYTHTFTLFDHHTDLIHIPRLCCE